jgi:hypothetical protein
MRDLPMLQVALLGFAAVLFLLFLASEIVRGRYARVDKRAPEEAGWLAANLPAPAEAAGAWDDVLGNAEVVATLARLSQEGRFKSRASGDGHDLVVELTAPRDAFSGHERDLVEKIFPGDWKDTSTSMLVHKFKGTYKLARVVRPGLRRHVAGLMGEPLAAWPRFIVPGVGFTAAAALVWSSGAPSDIVWQATLRLVLSGLVFAAPGLFVARQARRRIDWSLRGLVAALAPPLVVLALAWPIAADPKAAESLLGLPADARFLSVLQTALVCGALAWVAVLLNGARTRHRAAGLAARRRLAVVRAFFARELARPQPRLRDEWFPYVVALGLARASRRWNARHGAQAAPDGWTGGGPAVGGIRSAAWVRAARTFSRGGESMVHFGRANDIPG